MPPIMPTARPCQTCDGKRRHASLLRKPQVRLDLGGATTGHRYRRVHAVEPELHQPRGANLDIVHVFQIDQIAAMNANKTVLEANRLKVRTTSSLVVTGGSGLYYYPANAQDLPPNNQDGLLLFITYGAWGGQLAFPTGGGVYYRYGTTTFSAWKRLDS